MTSKSYRLYPKAVEDLEAIYLYTVREFGIDKAKDYILLLSASFKRLAEEPLLARKCGYIRENLRAFSIRSHIIFFKMTKTGIVIIRVLHQSMDFKRHF